MKEFIVDRYIPREAVSRKLRLVRQLYLCYRKGLCGLRVRREIRVSEKTEATLLWHVLLWLFTGVFDEIQTQ
jgi:hypothetical protein